MSDLLVTTSRILPFLGPPIIGAFIGYITNRIAIKMLFRPLRKWRIGPMPVPMTPGVIPAKRHTLAVNIGEMVGEHLITGEEIGKSLRKSEFQDHLYQLIESRLETLLKQDLGKLASIIPQKYGSYFDIAAKTVIYRAKESVIDYLNSLQFEAVAREVANSVFVVLESMKVDELLPFEQRKRAIEVLGTHLKDLVYSERFEITIKKAVLSKVAGIVNQGDSLRMLLPAQINDIVIDLVARQAPSIAESAGELIEQPEIKSRITRAILNVIEEFIENLGPMSAMVHNFLDMEMVEEKIAEFLGREDNEIKKILKDEKVILEIERVLKEKAAHLIDKPIGEILKEFDPSGISKGCDQISERIIGAIRQPDVLDRVNGLVHGHLEDTLESGEITIGKVLATFTGSSGADDLKSWLNNKILYSVRSKPAKDVVNRIVDQLATGFLEKPIGKLSNIVPAGVRTGIYEAIQQVATRMLTAEIPGILKSLNIRKIVTDRIDSFDLLRLEKLLLSIMEEQFKYINLFGGVLGFLIGCINLLFIYGMK